MKKILLALGLLFLLFPQVASAQSSRNPCFYATSIGARDGCTSVSTANPLPVAASVSASITGFTPNGNFANLTATNVSASVALPAGTTIAVQNTGTSTVSCTLGVGSATAVASQIQVAASSTVFVTPGSNTFLGCIDQSGSTSNVVALAGGAGLGAGFGGGGGGAGGSSAITTWGGATLGAATAWGVAPSGNVNGVNANIVAGSVSVSNFPATQPVSAASGSYAAGSIAAGALVAGSLVDGADVTQGAKADAVCGTATGTCSVVSLLKFLNTAAGSPTPAGTNVIGALTANQSVNLAQVNGVSVPVGSGVQATAQRMTLATDSPGIVALGIAAPSASIPVQGGGFNTAVAFTPTVQALAYSSGNAIGGLQTVSFFRSTAQPSGIFDNFQLISKGGSTVGMTVYLFDANPSGSTCTDKTAFSLATADISKLAVQPFVVTPAVVGAGTTATSSQYSQTVSVKNLDGSATVNLYACIVVTASVTPASTTDLVGVVSGALD